MSVVTVVVVLLLLLLVSDQATEPEALQAVACAGPHTCLIMAGDHKQMCLENSWQLLTQFA